MGSLGLPRVPMGSRWAPKGSPPMGSLWVPMGSPPMGSLGLPRVPLPWVPLGSQPMGSLGLPRVPLFPWDPLGSQGFPSHGIPWAPKGPLPWDLIDVKNTTKGFRYLSPNIVKLESGFGISIVRLGVEHSRHSQEKHFPQPIR